MGISERKERQKAELRQQILKAARDIVLRDGFAALTMRKIADAIEYAPGTLYLYFESRDEIAKQLCIQGYQELLDFLQPVAAIADARDRLIAIAESYVCFGMTHAATYRLIFMEDPKITSAALAEVPIDASDGPGIQAFQLLVRVFDDLKTNHGLVMEADSAQFAQLLWTSLHGIVSLKLTCSNFLATSAEELVKTMTHTFLAGLPLISAISPKEVVNPIERAF
jgi:AcrR family transcriptional regulator